MDLTQFETFENPRRRNLTPVYTAQIVNVADTNGDGSPVCGGTVFSPTASIRYSTNEAGGRREATVRFT